ncbi:MAG: hypothetical protein ACJ8KU_02370, partial [Chthoniobacterales bacterium]
HPGEYQVGRGLSGVVLQALGITASHFMAIVAGAENEHEIAQRVGLQEKRAVIRALSMRLRRLTVADVPSDLRPEFERYYGSNLPLDRRVFDVLEADDAKAAGGE